ncbi:hypothetical protein KAM448_35240 [Aeromonas caviae]|uniref:Uncharacterized protein n=1 Tax=Aeromonas caviae TaxID=648 RepID=A0ABD0B809_AERCA|nr:hypothetical protein KAM330_47820 [Aeromonas hydrophila]BCR31385.1 hypothetical protein KAM376_43910 [Aeromonas caviae]GJA71846.1 hypothetical protein KAM353_14930 [Aeromonas caviae]GJA81681.1 hypothetical protein KAM355_22410 [Aeromonas caviae]GJB00708.1 hypothetical protein KAM359_41150 [Aeromonas caviae]
MITVSRPGRPKAVNPISGKDRNNRYELKRQAEGYRKVSFWMDASTLALFEALRAESGFSSRDNSEFLAALLLKAAAKPWLGRPFTLPAQDLLRPLPAMVNAPRRREGGIQPTSLPHSLIDKVTFAHAQKNRGGE